MCTHFYFHKFGKYIGRHKFTTPLHIFLSCDINVKNSGIQFYGFPFTLLPKLS